jgi:hypothetical protein
MFLPDRNKYFQITIEQALFSHLLLKAGGKTCGTLA